jgi:hypothetical protein
MLATMLLSHAGNGVAEVTCCVRVVDAKSCWQRCCRVMLATVLPRQFGHDAM